MKNIQKIMMVLCITFSHQIMYSEKSSQIPTSKPSQVSSSSTDHPDFNASAADALAKMKLNKASAGKSISEILRNALKKIDETMKSKDLSEEAKPYLKLSRQAVVDAQKMLM